MRRLLATNNSIDNLKYILEDINTDEITVNKYGTLKIVDDKDSIKLVPIQAKTLDNLAHSGYTCYRTKQYQTGVKEDPSDFGLINSRGYEWQNGAMAGMTNIRDEKGLWNQ